MWGTVVNVTGDATVAAIVATSENEIGEQSEDAQVEVAEVED